MSGYCTAYYGTTWYGMARHCFCLHCTVLPCNTALHRDMALHSMHYYLALHSLAFVIAQHCIWHCTALHMAWHSNRHCPCIPGIIALHIRASLHYIPFSPLHCTPLHNCYASIAGHFGHSSMSLLGYLLALHIVNTTLYGKGSS